METLRHTVTVFEMNQLKHDLYASLPDTPETPEDILALTLEETMKRIPGSGRVVIMPAGRFAMTYGKCLLGKGYTISAYLDNYKQQGGSSSDIPVLEPEDLDKTSFDAVLFTTPSISAQQDMMDQLSELMPERKNDFHMLFDIMGNAFEGIIRQSVRKLEAGLHHAEKGKRLCITTPYLHHNYLKLMKYLKDAGYHVTVITGNRYMNGAIDIRSYEGQGFYDICHIACPYDVIMPRLLQHLDMDIVHAIVTSASSVALSRVLENKPCCFISDYCDFKEILYDTDEGFLTEMSQQQLNREKKAWRALFSMCDGVIIKDSPEIIEVLSKKYKAHPPWLQFMSYPSMAFAGSVNGSAKLHEKDGKTHIVYAGCVVNNPEAHAFSPHSSLLDIARELNDGGISFTIINAIDDGRGGFDEYWDLARELPLFSYKGVIAQDKLARELSVYDAGWFAFDLRNVIESDFFVSTTFGSKIFNYMEAGLPMIVSEECRAMVNWVEERGIGQRIKINGGIPLTEQIRSMDIHALGANVLREMPSLSMEKQIKRLIDFYQLCKN